MYDVERYTKIFKALSNPHRLQIFLKCLENFKVGSDTVEDAASVLSCERYMAKSLGIVPSTISHHLKELTNAGLLNVTRDGQRVITSINEDGVKVLRNMLDKMEG